MKRLLQIGLLFVAAASAVAQQNLAKYDWKDLAQRHELRGGQVISMDGFSVLKIENTNDLPLQLSLLRIVHPPISNLLYAVVGQIKYENVHGDGYLEMWNDFLPLHPGMPEGRYFSRTLGTSGEMGKITGTCDWRQFLLPFNRTGASGPPTRLEINIFLPGRGTVYLRAVKLVEFKGNTFSLGGEASAGWWSSRQGGMIGGIGGSVIGCFGGLLGCLAGMAKARKFVLVMTKIFIGLGILLTVAGLIAAVLKQPYAVWYVLILPGIILTAVFAAILPAVKKRYDDLEIRRMASVDATGG